jgi:hypothetical protein
VKHRDSRPHRGFCQNDGNREKTQDWLAEDAVPCELFSGPNSLPTGKFTGNFVSWAEVLRDKSASQTALEGKAWFSRRIGTGNDQGMNRDRNSLISRFAANYQTHEIL